MKNIILILAFLLIAFPAKAEESKIFFVEAVFNQGRLDITDVISKNGTAPAPQKEAEMEGLRYWVMLVSFQGDILEKRQFDISFEVFDDPSMQSDKINRFLSLPYYPNAKSIMLTDMNGNMMAQKDIGYLADLCGDNICEDHESFADCPKDCKAAGKDDYCNPEKINEDPDCGTIKNGVKETKEGNNGKKIIFLTITILSAIIVIVGGLILYKRRYKENSIV